MENQCSFSQLQVNAYLFGFVFILLIAYLVSIFLQQPSWPVIGGTKKKNKKQRKTRSNDRLPKIRSNNLLPIKRNNLPKIRSNDHEFKGGFYSDRSFQIPQRGKERSLERRIKKYSESPEIVITVPHSKGTKDGPRDHDTKSEPCAREIQSSLSSSNRIIFSAQQRSQTDDNRLEAFSKTPLWNELTALDPSKVKLIIDVHSFPSTYAGFKNSFYKQDVVVMVLTSSLRIGPVASFLRSLRTAFEKDSSVRYRVLRVKKKNRSVLGILYFCYTTLKVPAILVEFSEQLDPEKAARISKVISQAAETAISPIKSNPYGPVKNRIENLSWK